MNAAAQCITEELAAKLPEHRIAPLGQQILAQAPQTTDVRAVPESAGCVNRPSSQVPVALPADGVESFQRETEWINPFMAVSAARVAGVLFDELANREFHRPFFFGQLRHIFRRARQTFTEEHFGDPVATEDRACA